MHAIRCGSRKVQDKGVENVPGSGFRPITVILNIGSGSDVKQQIRQEITEVLTAAGHAFEIIDIPPIGDFAALCEPLVIKARRHGGMVVAAGGDGTVNTVSALCHKHDVLLGIIPLGTFNYFSRELKLPGEPAEAAKVLVTGKVRSVTVGEVNGRLFLNNASFGLYTSIIRQREQDKSRFGRFRIVALVSAILTMMRNQKPFAIKLIVEGNPQLRRTSMVFIGNNTLQLKNLELEVAQCAKEDRLAVVVMKPASRLTTVGLLLRGVLKNLNNDSRLEMFCTDSFSVESKRRKIDIVIDGEVIQCRTPLLFQVRRGALKVMVPAQEADK
jgi:diacylglycerol kinase family enzyme